jgi:ribosomal protein S27AE
VDIDIHDLAGAQAIQARFRERLRAVQRGESEIAYTTVSRVLERRADRLMHILTIPPRKIRERRHRRGLRTLTVGDPAYRIVSICPFCGDTFTAAAGAKRYTCGRRKCVVFADNTRRGRR